MLVVLLAVACLPMVMHCRLKTVPGFEFLSCQSESNSQNEQPSNCGGTGCCAAEKSQYKTEQQRRTVLPPNLLQQTFAPVLDLANALSGDASREAFTVTPPELPKCWQFVFRTASPPRAPSSVS